MAEAAALDDLLPRADISGQISGALLANLGSANWKERKASLDEVEDMIAAAGGRITPGVSGALLAAAGGACRPRSVGIGGVLWQLGLSGEGGQLGELVACLHTSACAHSLHPSHPAAE